MPRPKNEEGFRLIKRDVEGRKLFYARFLDEEGAVISTRSTGTDDERKAIKKALAILKTIPKSPLKQDPLFVDFLLGFWTRIDTNGMLSYGKPPNQLEGKSVPGMWLIWYTALNGIFITALKLPSWLSRVYVREARNLFSKT